MNCPKCGRQIDDNSSFCKYCGAYIETHTDDTSDNGEEPRVSSEHKPAYDSMPTRKVWLRDNKFFIIGSIIAAIGISGFGLIVLISLIIYGRVYLYDGYTFTGILCTLCIILQCTGSFLIVLGMIMGKKRKPVSRKLLVTAIILLCVALVCSVILISNAVKNKSSASSSSGYSSYSSSSSSEMSHSTYCMLYMRVSNVSVTHSGNYTYITGTIKNTGTYQVKYVKVRAACKDYSGNIIDTDWTYAVDSNWLNPGESKTFEMMVKDTSNRIRKADVTVIYD